MSNMLFIADRSVCCCVNAPFRPVSCLREGSFGLFIMLVTGSGGSNLPGIYQAPLHAGNIVGTLNASKACIITAGSWSHGE